MSQAKAAHRGPSLLERMSRKESARQQADPEPQPAAGEAVSPEENPAETPASPSEAGNVDQSVQLVDVELIDVEEQVRRHFDPDYIEDLATDFALDEHYQPQQPITLWQRPNGRYLLDTGENRLRAMKFAAENREAMGITDPAAFTTIRATIRGPEPSKLDRVQSQTKENVLRDSLNDLELGYAAEHYLRENPEATQKEIAEWMGFRKVASGRVRVSNALKLVRQCDRDLAEKVGAGELSTKNAFKIQDDRKAEKQAGQGSGSSAGAAAGKGKSQAEKRLQKATSGRKETRVSVSLETLQLASRVLGAVAKRHDQPLAVNTQGELDRKAVMQVFQEEPLQALLEEVTK